MKALVGTFNKKKALVRVFSEQCETLRRGSLTALFSTATVTESYPLHDVHDHPAEADLQGAEVRVDGEDLHDLEVAGDHPRPEQPLRDQVRVVRVPLLPAEVTFGPTYIIYPSDCVIVIYLFVYGSNPAASSMETI